FSHFSDCPCYWSGTTFSLDLKVELPSEPGRQIPSLRFLCSRTDTVGKLKRRLSAVLGGLPAGEISMNISLDGVLQQDSLMVV
ncbi:MAG TPA: hypothetical protein V6C97_16930, partial [Oculatellaceae cyanobacterium]